MASQAEMVVVGRDARLRRARRKAMVIPFIRMAAVLRIHATTRITGISFKPRGQA
jgi:hypothetical protein